MSSKLEMVWAQANGALRGAEGQPIVISDVGGKPMLFMVSGCPAMSNCNVVQALDLTDPDHPKAVWNYVKKTDRDELAVPRACCDTVNRGRFLCQGQDSSSIPSMASSLRSMARPAKRSGSSRMLSREGRDRDPAPLIAETW